MMDTIDNQKQPDQGVDIDPDILIEVLQKHVAGLVRENTMLGAYVQQLKRDRDEAVKQLMDRIEQMADKESDNEE